MTDELPMDVQQQMAPGGQFPGHAETLATPVGSDQPVRVKIGQKPNKHLQLSREEYRARSAQQREIDAQMSADTPANQEPQVGFVPPPPPETPKVQPGPPQKKRGRPKGVKNKPKPAVPPDEPIGRPYPATSPTAAPTPQGTKGGPPIGPPGPDPSAVAPPIPIPTDAMFEQRMARLEQGMDMIVRALAERDARAEDVHSQLGPGAEELLDPSAGDGYFEEDEPEPGESFDEPPTHVVATQVGDNLVLEGGLQRLQQMIAKRNPQKVFRQYWAQLTRLAQYNEWQPEHREAFDTLFNSIVAHPKFIHQMSKFLRSSRNGNCIGDEQIARVCGMMAGFLTVYQLATAAGG